MAARKRTSAGKILASLAQSHGRGRGRRSPLYLWFQQHHNELAAGFKRTTPAWQIIADALAEQGIRDADGKPPAAETARAAWWRVRRDVKAAAGTTSSLAQNAIRQTEMPAGVRTIASTPPPLPPFKPSSTPPPELAPLVDDRPRMPRPKFRNPK